MMDRITSQALRILLQASPGDERKRVQRHHAPRGLDVGEMVSVNE